MTAKVPKRPPNSPWYTLEEACAYARMGRDEMGDLLRSGALVGHQTKRGGRWRIHIEAIDAYLRDETYTTVIPAVAQRRGSDG